MNENIDLCKLLKGHNGEEFYSPALGTVTLISTDRYNDVPIEVHNGSEDVLLTSEGKLYDCEGAEIMLFPSKDQRDWNKWAEEQKPTPKTWNDIGVCDVGILYTLKSLNCVSENPIIRAAVALIKIHQLIEVGYGGNPTFKEKVDDNHLWMVTIHTYITIDDCNHNSYTIGIEEVALADNPIVFHSYEQAKEFLSYPENVQLVKDFYMI